MRESSMRDTSAVVERSDLGRWAGHSQQQLLRPADPESGSGTSRQHVTDTREEGHATGCGGGDGLTS